MKKILIISFSAGAGHTQAARALEETIKQSYPEITARHIDLADFINTFFKTATITSYEMLTKNAPKIWGSIFTLTDNKQIMKQLKKLSALLRHVDFPLYKEIQDFDPDHIVCTHFMPADLITHNKHIRPTPVSIIITDYGLHPIWLVDGVNTYFVATDEMKKGMIENHHIQAENIIVSDIPVHPQFFQKQNDKKTRNIYSIRPHIPTILVMSGGEGLMRADKVVEELITYEKPLNIIAIAGHNNTLKNKLENISLPPHISLTALGWTNDIPALMSIADIVVSKPGGMTTTECFITKTPLIAINPIPGQEEFNVTFLEEKKLGIQAKNLSDITTHLKNMLSSSPSKIHRAQNSAQIIIDTLLR